MRPVVEKILAEVEQRSGLPVLVYEDPSLTTIATIVYARGGAPAHLLSYRPQGGDPSYQIAFQAGHALRFFSLPAEKRMNFGLPNSRRDEAIRRLQIPGTLPSKVQDMLLDGLLLQLRSMSVGFRVDEWLRQSHPELRQLQAESVRQQLQENAKALSPQIRQSMPKQVVNGNTAMNGAYALFWSRVLGEAQQWLPYKALGYENQAGALLKALDMVPDEPGQDCALVDQWALTLGLAGTYEWSPYHA
jgi:hypothetical protein